MKIVGKNSKMTENASFTVCYESYLPVNNQPRSQGSLLLVFPLSERERDPGWVWSRGSRTRTVTRPNQGLSTCRRENLGSRLVNNVNVSFFPSHLTLATEEGIQELIQFSSSFGQA